MRLIGVAAILCVAACGGGGGAAPNVPSSGAPSASPSTPVQVSSYTTAVTTGSAATTVSFANVAGYSGTVILPATTTPATFTLTVSKSAPATASLRRAPQDELQSPLLYFSLSAADAAQLQSQPGFTISLQAASNSAYFLSVFDPTNPTANSLIGPGTYANGLLTFQTSSTSLLFNAGQTYEFVLFGLPITAASPSPAPSTAGSFQSYALQLGNNVVLTGTTSCSAIVSAPDGNLWLSCEDDYSGPSSFNAVVLKVSTTGTYVAYQSTLGGINWLTVGPTGSSSLYFPANAGNGSTGLGSIGLTGTYSILPPISGAGINGAMITGADGNVWASCGDFVCQIDPNSGALLGKFATTGSAGSFAVGPDGNVWFTESQGYIGKVTPAGSVTEYAVAGQPSSITAGSDGKLWFSASNSGTIGEITTSGAVTTYYLGSINPSEIITAKDGTYWLAAGSQILHVSATGSIIQAYAVPNGGYVSVIAQGADLRIWFQLGQGMTALTP